MTFQQLECFAAVERYRNFTEAAERSYISQSSLSKIIKSLEEELGCKLFVRNTRSVDLSEAGRIFAVSAKRLIQEYEQMRRHMAPYTGDERKSIRIASIPILNHYGITDKIVGFQNRHPDVEIRIQELDSRLAGRALLEDEADLAIIRDNDLPQAPLQIYPLLRDELVLLTGKSHGFSDRGTINLAEARDEEFLFMNSDTGIYEISVEACRNAGFVPREHIMKLRARTIMNLIGHGEGVSLMMRKMVEYFHDPEVSIVRLSDQVVSNLILAVKEQAMDEKMRLFVDDLRAQCGAQPPSPPAP